MKKIYRYIGILLLVLSCQEEGKVGKSTIKKPNVLFIAVDDLRPELGAYGSKMAITPNLDALAGDGLLFENAYCQQAICSPSRASLMTGARPETIGVIENYTYFRDVNPDIITLPQHFRNNGYETVYAGKIYHGKFTDSVLSWSRQPAVDKVKFKKPNYPGAYALKENQEIYKRNQAEIRAKYNNVSHYALGRGPAYESADVPDHAYIDGYHTELAIATLRELVENDSKPFFLGLGFRLPHLDWNAPKKYWDLYDREKISITDHVGVPKDGAAMGLHASFELRVRHGIPKNGPIDGELAKTLKHAYLASVSYVDAQIGKMLAALEENGVRNNTIIMVWSDHGWHLGDMGVWGKATNYEIATRVPLILWTPNTPKETRGRKTNALVELIDMYPTLCELAGLEIPNHVEGQSFAPLTTDPGRKWKKAVFSQFPSPALREWAANPLTAEMRETYFGPLIEEVEERIIKQQKDSWNRDFFENDLMGYSMRTERYRLIAWKDFKKLKSKPIYVELYDHKLDPYETTNVADENPDLVNRLISQMGAGWMGNLANAD